MNNSPSILLVDDRLENLVAMEAMLEDPAWFVEKAFSGESALGAMLDRDFALVLLDVQMPGMDGFETACLMRSTARTRHIPIIFVTAIGKDDGFVFEGYGLGAVDYLFKPIDPEIIRSKVCVFVDLYRQRKEIEEKSGELQKAYDDLERIHRQVQDDLDAAARIQKAQLPGELSEFDRARFAWSYSPCDQLAGDMFNVVRLDDDQLAVYLLDVSGHGVQAALLSSALNVLLRSLPGGGSVLWETDGVWNKYRIASPVTVLERLNQRFPMDLDTCQYFTILYGVLNVEIGEYRFASAGHPGPILATSTKVADMCSQDSSPPIGWFKEIPVWKEHSFSLSSGDRMFLYSDGITEAFGPSGDQFGTERLLASISESRGLDLKEAVRDTARIVEEWMTDSPKDDSSIIAVEML